MVYFESGQIVWSLIPHVPRKGVHIPVKALDLVYLVITLPCKVQSIFQKSSVKVQIPCGQFFPLSAQRCNRSWRIWRKELNPATSRLTDDPSLIRQDAAADGSSTKLEDYHQSLKTNTFVNDLITKSLQLLNPCRNSR